MSEVIGGAPPQVRTIARPAPRRQWIRWESLEFISTVTLGALVLVGALFYVWQHIHVVRLGYEIEGLREEQAALVQENKELKLEMGQLRSLKRVEEIARTRLGERGVLDAPDHVEAQALGQDRLVDQLIEHLALAAWRGVDRLGLENQRKAHPASSSNLL